MSNVISPTGVKPAYRDGSTTPDQYSANDRNELLPAPDNAPQPEIPLASKGHPAEIMIRFILTACALISTIITIGMVVILLKETYIFFWGTDASLSSFFSGTIWQPVIGRYGLLPLLASTLMTSLTALAVAVPGGTAAAVYLNEYAAVRTRNFVKPLLDIIAGVPTVVYGFFALTFMTPLLRSMFGKSIVHSFNTFSAGIVTGILILPLITALVADALKAVPDHLRAAAYGLGATRMETSARIVLPAAFSGIIAAVMTGFSRALGETMIAALAAGSGPSLTINPFAAAETMTGFMIRVSGGDAEFHAGSFHSIFALGFILYLGTLLLNAGSRRIIRKFRERAA